MVISDIVMPEMDGYQLCREIKQNDRLKDIPVILLTSLSSPLDVVRGLECGADNFLIKPYDEKYILSRIQYIIANKNLREVEQTQFGVEIVLNNERYFIKSDRIQILNLLLSSYEAAIQKNGELIKAQKELNTVNAQLEVVNKELESFAFSVSHDLRAPLRHITGFVEMLKEECAAGLNEKSRHYLTVIFDAAIKMGCLIDDLLSFSRMGRSEMMERSVDLKLLTHEVIEEVSRDIPVDNSVEWRIGNLPVVIGDRAMLRLVLVNLLSNAVKFSRNVEKPLIEVDMLAPEDNWHILYVRDNGAGFDMKYVDKLFGLFQRLHAAEEYKGTGVGLANVRRIITRHGGRTWAEGEPNKGATFYFTLPEKME